LVSDEEKTFMKKQTLLVFVLVIALPSFAAPETADSAAVDRIIVTGRKNPASERVVVEKEAAKTGLTDDINKILILKPGVSQIPEAGSSLLIRGEGPFDNSFRMYNVPIFAPSHFSNSTFCDHSATMINTVNEFRVVTDQMAGRYSGASSSVISCDPAISRPADARLIPRPELSIGIGTLCQDLSLSVPFRNGADISQLSFTNTDSYRIHWRNGFQSRSSEQAALGYGMASTFGDLVYTGTNAWKQVTLREYALFAYDVYLPSMHGPGMTVPWGITAASVEDSLANGVIAVSAGASRQYYYEGKKYFNVVPLAQVERTNATMRGSIASVKKGASYYDAAIQLERLEWTGSQIMLPNPARSVLSAATLALAETTTCKETEVTIHAGARRETGRLSAGLNVLFGGVAPWYRLYVDPGAWARMQFDRSSLGISGGIATSRPDIRGLPSYDYRGGLQKTYSLSVNGTVTPAKWLDAGADAYVKWKDRCPARSLVLGNLVWDPSLESRLLCAGIATSATLSPLEHWTFTLFLDAARANRISKDHQEEYEWNVPWSWKSIIRYSVFSDRLQFFLIGFFSEGLPYREIISTDSGVVYAAEYSRVPMYKRVDLKIQLNQRVEKHRFLTRYDAYVEVGNIFDWPNVREYYWDYDMARLPIFLERIEIAFGLRLGFRM
jgi:hypothetical protein